MRSYAIIIKVVIVSIVPDLILSSDGRDSHMYRAYVGSVSCRCLLYSIQLVVNAVDLHATNSFLVYLYLAILLNQSAEDAY